MGDVFYEDGLTAGTTYAYTFRAFDLNGLEAAAVPLSVTTDTPAPATGPVTSASITDITSTAVSMGWVNPVDAGFAGVKIYRAGALKATLSSSVTSYTETGLTPATPYVWTIRAYDTAGLLAPGLSVAAYTEAATPVVGPVTNLRLTSTTDDIVAFAWDNPTAAAYVGARVRRGAVTFPAVLKPGSAFYETGLDPDTTYTWTVAAYGTDGIEAAAMPITETTDPDSGPVLETGPVSNPLLSSKTDDVVAWTWTNPTDVGFAGTRVYRGGVLKATHPEPEFTSMEAGLAPSTSYTWVLKAYDTNGLEAAGVNFTQTTNATTNPPAGTRPYMSSSKHDDLPAGMYAKLDGVRLYQANNWDQPPEPREQIANGKVPWYSTLGTNRTIAEYEVLANWLKNAPGSTGNPNSDALLTNYHEPENDSITPATFIQQHDRMYQALVNTGASVSAGGHVWCGPCMIGYNSFNDPTGALIETYKPDNFDFMGIDVYNVTGNTTVADLMDIPYQWCRDHNVPLAIGEFSTHGTPQERAAWVRSFYTWANGKEVIFASWFNSNIGGRVGPSYWWFDIALPSKLPDATGTKKHAMTPKVTFDVRDRWDRIQPVNKMADTINTPNGTLVTRRSANAAEAQATWTAWENACEVDTKTGPAWNLGIDNYTRRPLAGGPVGPVLPPTNFPAGTTDQSVAISNAIAAVPVGGTYVLPRGIYNIAFRAHPQNPTNYQTCITVPNNRTFDFSQAELRLLPGQPRKTNAAGQTTGQLSDIISNRYLNSTPADGITIKVGCLNGQGAQQGSNVQQGSDECWFDGICLFTPLNCLITGSPTSPWATSRTVNRGDGVPVTFTTYGLVKNIRGWDGNGGITETFYVDFLSSRGGNVCERLQFTSTDGATHTATGGSANNGAGVLYNEIWTHGLKSHGMTSYNADNVDRVKVLAEENAGSGLRNELMFNHSDTDCISRANLNNGINLKGAVSGTGTQYTSIRLSLIDNLQNGAQINSVIGAQFNGWARVPAGKVKVHYADQLYPTGGVPRASTGVVNNLANVV